MPTVAEIVSFWQKYGYYDTPREKLEEYIKRHIENKTLLVEGDPIIGICRFNMIGDECQCLDVVIKPEYRFKNLLKLFLIKGLHKYPYAKKLSFERGLKKRRWKTYDIYKVLGVRHDTHKV